ncbi:MAG: serpin family protein [Micrococcales bacterium]|nr:serpin family protein [Micrococcales bacterium]
MYQRRTIVWVALATAGLMVGCGQAGSDDPAPAPTTAAGTTTVNQDVVAASWALGVQALRASGETNVVVSPSSLVTALAMLGEGAVGAAEAAPFDAALGASGADRTDAVVALLEALRRYDGDPAAVQGDLPATPVLHTAQQIALDDDAKAAPTFMDRLSLQYGAPALVTDLSSPAGIAELSAWVKDNTGGLVEASGIVPDPENFAVIQDALVLAAAWEQPFDPADTYNADFHVGDQVVQVPTMHAELSVSVNKGGGWQAVRLRYSDTLSADLVLPLGCDCPPDATCECPEYPEVHDPRLIDPQTLADLLTALDDVPVRTVRLSVPVLDLATTTDLMDLLEIVGIDREHPLSGVRADGEPVVVTQAVQQAVLEVAEDGTRAAAVTEIAVVPKSAPLPDQVEQIRFDRPFLLVVRDGTTGWPVLLASITDPR